jgi:hypothetical protein
VGIGEHMLIEGRRCCVILIVHNHPRPPSQQRIDKYYGKHNEKHVQCEKYAQYRLQTGEFMNVLLTCSRMTMCSVQLVFSFAELQLQNRKQ